MAALFDREMSEQTRPPITADLQQTWLHAFDDLDVLDRGVASQVVDNLMRNPILVDKAKLFMDNFKKHLGDFTNEDLISRATQAMENDDAISTAIWNAKKAIADARAKVRNFEYVIKGQHNEKVLAVYDVVVSVARSTEPAQRHARTRQLNGDERELGRERSQHPVEAIHDNTIPVANLSTPGHASSNYDIVHDYALSTEHVSTELMGIFSEIKLAIHCLKSARAHFNIIVNVLISAFTLELYRPIMRLTIDDDSGDPAINGMLNRLGKIRVNAEGNMVITNSASNVKKTRAYAAIQTDVNSVKALARRHIRSLSSAMCGLSALISNCTTSMVQGLTHTGVSDTGHQVVIDSIRDRWPLILGLTHRHITDADRELTFDQHETVKRATAVFNTGSNVRKLREHANYYGALYDPGQLRLMLYGRVDTTGAIGHNIGRHADHVLSALSDVVHASDIVDITYMMISQVQLSIDTIIHHESTYHEREYMNNVLSHMGFVHSIFERAAFRPVYRD